MLKPYFERAKGVPESEYRDEEGTTKEAWADLGDKHPDFKYAL